MVVSSKANVCDNWSLFGISENTKLPLGNWTDSFQRVTKFIETDLETHLKLLQYFNLWDNAWSKRCSWFMAIFWSKSELWFIDCNSKILLQQIHQSYPSAPVKFGDNRDEVSLLSSPAASPSTNHRGAIIPAFLPGHRIFLHSKLINSFIFTTVDKVKNVTAYFFEG